MKKKSKRRIANTIMVLVIVLFAAIGIIFAGKVRGWF